MDEPVNPTPEEDKVNLLPKDADLSSDPPVDTPMEGAEASADAPASEQPPRETPSFDSSYQLNPPQQKPPRRPFFRDTWEIFRNMFTRNGEKMLSIAANDNYPIWRANFLVVLAAELISSLLSFGLTPPLRMLFDYQVSWVVGLILLSLILTGVNLALLVVALRTAAKRSGAAISWQSTANVVSCCTLVTAAIGLAGSLIPSVGGLLSILICAVVLPVLLYSGYRNLTGDAGHLWPFLWSIVLWGLAAILLTVIAIGLFAAGTLFGYTYYYF